MKYAIMSIILASYDGCLNDKKLTRDDWWYEIEILLKSGKEVLRDLIERWTVDFEKESVFRIMPLVRKVKASAV